jgi:hypothetical protein
MILMSDKLDKHKIEELRAMVKDKDSNQSVEELLAAWTFLRKM